MFSYILPLSSDQATLSVAGGKGANLSELIRAGFNVPPGFIITTGAYKLFVDENGFHETILSLTRNIGVDDAMDFEKISEDISRFFKNGNIPGAILQEANSAYRQLAASFSTKSLPVAVRSSATAEDLPGLAFAGQQDTFLNVTGEDQLLEAVKNCWASIWTARAISYRVRNRISSESVSLAVVVQAMINAECSGVAFTANPSTGRRDEIVINASFGLGEAVVSGLVDPDEYVVDLLNFENVRRKLGSKRIVIAPDVRGGTQHVVDDRSLEQALTDEQIISLVMLSSRVAKHFGIPQDIEWALASGQFYVLQSRPITSLYPLPESAKADGDLQVYVNFNSIQGLTMPLTPLGIDVLRTLFGGVRKLFRLRRPMTELLPDAGGRLFMNLTDPIKSPKLGKIVLSELTDVEPGSQQILSDLIAAGRINPKQALSVWGAIRLVVSLLPLIGRVARAFLSPETAYPRAVNIGEAFMKRIKSHASMTTDLGNLLRTMQTDLSGAEEISFQIMPTALPAYGLIPLLDRWLVNWLGEPSGSAMKLMRGLPNNVTTEMDLKLWELASKIGADPLASEKIKSENISVLVEKYRLRELPLGIQNTVDEFLLAYGMRAIVEIDIGRPRWRDDPTPVFQTLVSYMQLYGTGRTPGIVFHRNKDEAENLAADYVARLRKTRYGWLRAKLVGAAVRRIRALAGLRETPLFYMISTIDVYRTALIESAHDLVARGLLECEQDIFFLPFNILQGFAENDVEDSPKSRECQAPDPILKGIVKKNREDYERETMRKQMPRVLLSTGEAFYDPTPKSDSEQEGLVGEAVSPGVAEGIVHVILDPREARVQPGEILVCPSTDPGWTPLFLLAGGLVMEIGGMITHGSIVAREYGIPAVVAVRQATTRLRNGQRVRVDGSRGVITLLEQK